MMHELEKRVDDCLKSAQIQPDQRVLLAVSGGRDSMVLGEVLYQLGQAFAVAHVNYRLRGDDSEADAAWVAQCAKRWGAQFHLMETNREALGANVQQGARALRYKWMFGLCSSHGYAALLTAHHQADQAETFLLAAFKGRGSRAMAGMRMWDGRLMRPMLSIEIALIAAYAADRKISWREDASNQSFHYDRNFIRHELLPLVENRFPAAVPLLAREAERLQQLEAVAMEQLDFWRQRIVTKPDENYQRWEINDLPVAYGPWFIGRLCAENGLEQGAIEAVADLWTKEAGKRVETKAWTIVRTRNGFDWFKPEVTEKIFYHIGKEGAYSIDGHILQVHQSSHFDAQASFCLPASLVAEQLVLRSWKAGDTMRLASGGSKKISDLLQEQQINHRDRQQVLVLAQDKDIFWVIGFRKRTFDAATAAQGDWLIFNLVPHDGI